jgi:hypothetical protein
VHTVPRRLEGVEQLAFRVEGILARRRASVLEQIARTDELQELVADILIGAPYVIDIEAAVRPLVAEHEGTRRDPRNAGGDIVVCEPEGPEKSCACHRFRHSSDSR